MTKTRLTHLSVHVHVYYAPNSTILIVLIMINRKLHVSKFNVEYIVFLYMLYVDHGVGYIAFNYVDGQSL